MNKILRDKQQDQPSAYCEKCGTEIYDNFVCHYDGLELCKDCYKFESKNDN